MPPRLSCADKKIPGDCSRRFGFASFTRFEYDRSLCLYSLPHNGGFPGIGYWITRSPCSSEVHSVPSIVQTLTLFCSLYRIDATYSSSSQLLIFNFKNYMPDSLIVNRKRNVQQELITLSSFQRNNRTRSMRLSPMDLPGSTWKKWVVLPTAHLRASGPAAVLKSARWLRHAVE